MDEKDTREEQLISGEGELSEYVVLNRREEEGEETGQRGLEVYEELARYQYFDCQAIGRSMRLTSAVQRKVATVLRDQNVILREVESGYMEGRMETVGEAFGEGREGKLTFPLHMVFTREKVLFAECQCSQCRKHYYSIYYRSEYCAYLGAFLTLVDQDLKDRNLGDATDARAQYLLSAFSEQRANTVVSDTIGRAESLTLAPRITLRNRELYVSFRVGERKMFVVKDLFEFYHNVQESRTVSYGSSTKLNHHLGNFTPRSREWIDFIGRIAKEEQAFERRLQESGSYSKRAVSKTGELALYGWRLDELYQLWGEDSMEFEDKNSQEKKKTFLCTRNSNPSITMTIRENSLGSIRTFHGVEVHCRMPYLYYGGRFPQKDTQACGFQQQRGSGFSGGQKQPGGFLPFHAAAAGGSRGDHGGKCSEDRRVSPAPGRICLLSGCPGEQYELQSGGQIRGERDSSTGCRGRGSGAPGAFPGDPEGGGGSFSGAAVVPLLG